MVQYDWEILSLYTVPSIDGLNNVVKRITWRYQAKDGSYAGDIYHDTYLDSPNPQTFIQYDNLTKETIIGWIESTEDMTKVEEDALARLNESKNPSIVEKKVPWDYELKYDLKDLYVLVHQDEVVYGPVHWHSDIMNKNLEKLGLDPSLPIDIMARKQGIVPINQPTAINEETKIYKADMQNEQPEESLFTDNGHIIWDFSTGVAVGTYVAIGKPIEEVKENLRNVVANKRNEKELEGTNVTIGEETFKILTGPISRLLLVEKLNVMGDTDTCMWKFMENRWSEVSKDNVLSMLGVVDSYVQNLVNWEHGLVQQIEAANSVDDLKEISLD